MGDDNDTALPRFGGQPAREPDACAEDSVLVAILHAACDPAEDDPVGAALEAFVIALGLSRASLALVRDDGDLRRLKPIAAAGEHASFARDMPAIPLEQMADAAVAVTERRPHYVADVHGLGELGEEAETGVARWRQGMGAQAHALLPVTVHDRVVGVLTAEWSSPQEFTQEERTSLEAVALLFGLVLSAAEQFTEQAESEEAADDAVAGHDRVSRTTSAGLPSDQGSRPNEQPTVAALPDDRFFGYVVSDAGVVFPDALDGSLTCAAAMRVTVASGEPSDTLCPFWDVVGVAPGALAVIGGTVQAPRGGARSLAEECGRILRASCSQGRSPAEALQSLSSWLLASGPGNAWVSGGCWRIDAGKRVMTGSGAGAIANAHRSSDGRMEVSVSELPALGANAGRLPSDEFALVLPGDTVVLCAGSVGWVRAGAGQRALGQALAREEASTRHRRAVEQLVSLATDASIAPFIAIIDVLGG